MPFSAHFAEILADDCLDLGESSLGPHHCQTSPRSPKPGVVSFYYLLQLLLYIISIITMMIIFIITINIITVGDPGWAFHLRGPDALRSCATSALVIFGE